MLKRLWATQANMPTHFTVLCHSTDIWWWVSVRSSNTPQKINFTNLPLHINPLPQSLFTLTAVDCAHTGSFLLTAAASSEKIPHGYMGRPYVFTWHFNAYIFEAFWRRISVRSHLRSSSKLLDHILCVCEYLRVCVWVRVCYKSTVPSTHNSFFCAHTIAIICSIHPVNCISAFGVLQFPATYGP